MLKEEDFPFDVSKHDVDDIVEFIISETKEWMEEEESEADYLTKLIRDLTLDRKSVV